MSEQAASTAVMALPTEPLGEQDTFRRATFNWAIYTRRMVESSRALTPTTKVSPSALADIAYARDMLDELFVPRVTAAGEVASEAPSLTAEDLQQTVDGLAERAQVSIPAQRRPGVRVIYASQNWSDPVWPKNGRMLWAWFDCPSCPSKGSGTRSEGGQRCQRPDGGFLEKPHPARKALVARL